MTDIILQEIKKNEEEIERLEKEKEVRELLIYELRQVLSKREKTLTT